MRHIDIVINTVIKADDALMMVTVAVICLTLIFEVDIDLVSLRLLAILSQSREVFIIGTEYCIYCFHR